MIIDTLDKLFFDASSVQKQNIAPGQYVFRQGDPAPNIYAVESGQVKLERYTLEGRNIIMHIANAGDSFAEAALSSEIYHCNATAIVPSIIHIYPKKNILRVLRSQPDKAEEYIALLASQVRALRTKLEIRNILSARERMLQHFFLIANPSTAEITLNMPHKEIAGELGLAHETFYRELSKLEKDGVIRRRGNKILLI